MNVKLEKLQEEALKKASIYQRLFHSAEGKIILKDLEDAFERTPMFSATAPHLTHVRAGELNVINYIKDVLEVTTDA